MKITDRLFELMRVFPLDHTAIAQELNIPLDEWKEARDWYLHQIAYGAFLRALKDGASASEHLVSARQQWDVIRGYMDDQFPGFSFVPTLSMDFIETALEAATHQRFHVSILLMATVVEHELNIFYRELLLFQEVPYTMVTQVIRTTNFDSKIGWLFRVTTKEYFPEDLRARLNTIIIMLRSLQYYPFVLNDTRVYDTHLALFY